MRRGLRRPGGAGNFSLLIEYEGASCRRGGPAGFLAPFLRFSVAFCGGVVRLCLVLGHKKIGAVAVGIILIILAAAALFARGWFVYGSGWVSWQQ